MERQENSWSSLEVGLGSRFLTSQKKIFDIIAGRVENVTPWLAKRMLASNINV